MTREASSFDLVFGEAIDQMGVFGEGTSVSALLQRIVASYGLRNAAYLAIYLPKTSPSAPYIAATYSDEWIGHYRAHSYHRHDPVILRGLDSLLPIDWAVLDKSAPRVRRLFGEATEYGVGRHGLSFPIRGRHGERAIFTVTADETDQAWLRIRRQLVRELLIVAHHVHRYVLSMEAIEISPVRLAPREVECLQWAAAGKTQPEMATILGLSERTVICYLETARHKLDAMNTTHAVAKAISMNLFALGM